MHMLFYNISNPKETATFNEAVMRGAAGGRGIYFPETIPGLSVDFISQLSHYSLAEIAYEVLRHYTGNELSDNELQTICQQVFQFPIPLARVHDTVYSLELYHGPSLSFKDVGTRFLASLLNLYVQKYQRRFTVLVATSGDTGSAVAKSLQGTEGVQVVLLYPKGKVSDIQEKTLSTFGDNVQSLEIEGTFDDCQYLVKSAFNDAELARELQLTSANSINIARFLPQSVYYFKAWADLGLPPEARVSITVPSGNFGNLTGGLIAWKMGLPIHQYVAATNTNRVVPEYLETGHYVPRPSHQTLSNAMDVGNPSNFVRIQELFQQQLPALKQQIKGFSMNDNDTLATMKTVYERTGYLLDPHGAIGYAGSQAHKNGTDAQVFLETAHPAKFKTTVEQATGSEVPIPGRLKAMIDGPKRAHSLPADFDLFKGWLLAKKE